MPRDLWLVGFQQQQNFGLHKHFALQYVVMLRILWKRSELLSPFLRVLFFWLYLVFYSQMVGISHILPNDVSVHALQFFGSHFFRKKCWWKLESTILFIEWCIYFFIFIFFCFRTGFQPIKGGQLIRLVRRGMRTGQALFPLLYRNDPSWDYYIECYISVMIYSHSDSGVYHPSTWNHYLPYVEVVCFVVIQMLSITERP